MIVCIGCPSTFSPSSVLCLSSRSVWHRPYHSSHPFYEYNDQIDSIVQNDGESSVLNAVHWTLIPPALRSHASSPKFPDRMMIVAYFDHVFCISKSVEHIRNFLTEMLFRSGSGDYHDSIAAEAFPIFSSKLNECSELGYVFFSYCPSKRFTGEFFRRFSNTFSIRISIFNPVMPRFCSLCSCALIVFQKLVHALPMQIFCRGPFFQCACLIYLNVRLL